MRGIGGLPRAALILALVGLVLRVALIASTPHPSLTFDAADFHRHATGIADGRGYPSAVLVLDRGTPTAFRPPLYPHLLGAVYKLAPGTVTAGRLLGALLGAVTVLLIFAIAERLWDRRAAIAAGALAAVFPPFLALVSSLNTEVLFIPLELGMVLALLAYRSSGGALRWAVAAGLLCGLATATRGNGFVLVPPLLLALFAVGGRAHLRRFGVAAAAALLVVAVVLTPWTIRNAYAFDGKLVPVSTSGGYALEGTFNDQAQRGAGPGARWQWRPPDRDPANRAIYYRRGVTEADINADLSDKGRDYILDHPGYAVEATALNTYRLVNPKALPDLTTLSYDAFSVPRRLRGLATYGYMAVALLALAGLVLAVRRRQLGPLWLWSIPVLLAISFAMLNGDPRYRTTIDPFLILLAGLSLASLARGAQARGHSRGGGRRPLVRL